MTPEFQGFLERLHASKDGPQWKALCPAHADKQPSLGIKLANDGKVLLHCHAGCSTESVCQALGMEVRDLSPNGHSAREIVDTYDYVDEGGKLLYQVVRFEPKTFRQRKPDGQGGWIWNLNGVCKVLYHLPELAGSEQVFIVEGEKDVDTLRSLGIVATTNPGGAGKWYQEYSEFLRGKNVVIIADNDEPGRKHAQVVAISLHLIAASLKLINVLPMPDGQGVKDVTEWVSHKFDRGLLLALAADTPAWTPGTVGEKLSSCSVAELFAAREKDVDWLVWPFASVGLSTILDALPKVGKTVFILRGIYASLYGKSFLNFPTKKMRVVYVSEQSRPSLAFQMREIGFTGDEPIEELRVITREDWSRHIYTDFLAKLEKEILASGNYNFLALDTFHTIARLEDEKDASEVNRLGNATLDVASRNSLGLVLGRHDRKSGGEVGVSGRSSIQLSGLVDTILHLVRVPNEKNQRKLEAISRVPLPNDQIIELMPNGEYLNWGEPQTESQSNQKRVDEWVKENPQSTGEQIVAKFAALVPPVAMTPRNARRLIAATKERM